MPEPRWLSESELRAWGGLQFMQRRLLGGLARSLEANSNLSLPDYEVLIALTAQPEGRHRLFELAEDLAWEKSRLSHHVTRMVDRGLVEKQRCSADRRGWHVSVTAEGRQAIAAAAPSHVETVRKLFVDRLSPKQLAAVAEVAEVVLSGLSEEGG